MKSELELYFELHESQDEPLIWDRVAEKLGCLPEELPALSVKKRSLDARGRRVRWLLTIGEPMPFDPERFALRTVQGNPVIIIGAGPAGLFCAHALARYGIKSLIFERGKKVQARRRDLKGLTQHGLVNPDSNYCFGEGGAGTYSDGKLYTRSHKRGSVRDVLEILVTHGAPESILVEARPHIGSNRLPKVVTAIRENLESVGVDIHFESKVSDLIVERGRAIGVRLESGVEHRGQSVVVATGHSSRDMFEALQRAGAHLEAKPFAMGVRIEHPQPLINRIQYGSDAGNPILPAAPYRLAYTPSDGRGAFSFCMCPGGWIVPASTEAGALVMNGMSLSRRDSPYANSGFVVAIHPSDWARHGLESPWGGLELQRRMEQAAWEAGGGGLCAPAARATDFVKKRVSSDLPSTSYQPGIRPADLDSVLNASGVPIADRLREALLVFDQKMPGYLTEEAVLVGVESRTSSPVRVIRDPVTLESISLPGLYPCSEGAGYAGGIVSAAIDGVAVAERIHFTRH
ncbi:MAG: NAD(P)/FAD-dependent oxidoreductase [Myxococcaceae bacterium]|nr:NAD(P)/FAD-dependent oxidoreductase [Myxococcaceae bacterium]MBH2006715.1 NAD(P)/FAD-dependent oxidoreductase [Myxococcaceae bacterium]